MKNKKIALIISIISVIAFLLSYIISYANTDQTIYVNLTELNSDGIGYGIGNPKNSSAGNYIWNLATYNSNNTNDKSTVQRNLYCVKANYGDTWNANQNSIVAYNLSYDLQNDRKTVLEKLVDNNGTDADDVVKRLLRACY